MVNTSTAGWLIRPIGSLANTFTHIALVLSPPQQWALIGKFGRNPDDRSIRNYAFLPDVVTYRVSVVANHFVLKIGFHRSTRGGWQ